MSGPPSGYRFTPAGNDAEREKQVSQIIERLKHLEAEATRLWEELARSKTANLAADSSV